jgi:hypothetical protein
MPNGEFATMDKIELMAQSLPSELYNELYPQKLGERVMIQAPELRLTVLAKYEGMGIISQKLGADISKLEAMIEEEGKKIIEGKY